MSPAPRLLITFAVVALACSAGGEAAAAGGPCTITGTGKGDTLRGTPGPDVICPRDGQNVVYAGAGDDVVYGGNHSDVVHGGPGDDVIVDNLGLDRLFGGGGSDRLSAGHSRDLVDGGPGDDDLDGGPDVDRCISHAGDVRRPGCDDAAPRLRSLTVDRRHVDTSEAPQTITATLRLTDESGLAWASCSFVVDGPRPAVASVAFGPADRVAGTAIDGVYSSAFTLPQFSAHGTWRPRSCYIRDTGGRDARRVAGPVVQATASVEQTGPGDIAPPRLVDIGVGAGAIDTSAGPVDVPFSAHVTDDLAGVAEVRVIATARGPKLQWRRTVSTTLTSADLASGNPRDGVYTGVLRFPRFAPRGTWRLWLSVEDRTGRVSTGTHELSRALACRTPSRSSARAT